jgi:SRSO17 transposase
VQRKNSWRLAEHAGHPSRYRLEYLLDGRWDAGLLRDEVRSYVVTHVGDADAALILDDTQVIEKGRKSVGVAPQHCGLTGQTENCQTVVMAAYASQHGHAFLGRELYLPARWVDDPGRCAEAGVAGERIVLHTKPQLAGQMIERALAAQVTFRWVCTDSGYGKDPGLRRWCRDQRLSYVMAVPVSLPLSTAPAPARQVSAAGDLIGRIRVDAWAERSCADGTKGQRRYDWAAIAVSVKDEPPATGFAHTILVRRSIADRNDVEFFLVHAPNGTPIGQMIAAAGLRWKIEKQRPGQGPARPGPVPGSQVDTVAPARHRQHARPRLPRRHPRDTGKSTPAHTGTSGRVSIGYSINEIRHLLARLVLTAVTSAEHVLSWSHHRRQHQTRALISHHRQREDPLPFHLRM